MKKEAIGKSAANLTVAKVITTMISLISSMLLSRFRTVEEYGTYSQLIIVITLATSLIMLGLPNSINYYLALSETKEERKHFLSVYYSLSTLLSIVIGVVLVNCVPLIERYFNNDTIKQFSYFLAVYPWAHITISSISNVLVVYGYSKKLMTINIASALISLLSILLIQLLGLSFGEYIAAFLFGNVALCIVIYIIVFRIENGLKIQFDFNLIKKILLYSIPIGLSSLVGTVNVEVDKLMIGRMMDSEHLAYYANAGKELPLAFVATSFTAVLLPRMAMKLKNKDNIGAVRLWGNAILISYYIICFFSTACIVFAPQIMTILYSEKYLPGAQVFRIYSLVLILRCTYFGMILNSSGKTKLIFISSLISLGLNVLLNYTMYIFIGFEGPAIASFFAILIVNIIQLVFTSRLLGIGFRLIFPWKKIGEITLLNIFWGGIAYCIIKSLRLGTNVKDIIGSIIIGAVFAITYYLFVKKSVLKLWKMLNADE